MGSKAKKYQNHHIRACTSKEDQKLGGQTTKVTLSLFGWKLHTYHERLLQQDFEDRMFVVMAKHGDSERVVQIPHLPHMLFPTRNGGNKKRLVKRSTQFFGQSVSCGLILKRNRELTQVCATHLIHITCWFWL